MPGTIAGGHKARETNKKKYGDNFYRMIGSKGGQKTGIKKGFALNPALAKKAGAKGGKISRRTGVTTGQGKINNRELIWKGGSDALVFKKETTD